MANVQSILFGCLWLIDIILNDSYAEIRMLNQT